VSGTMTVSARLYVSAKEEAGERARTGEPRVYAGDFNSRLLVPCGQRPRQAEDRVFGHGIVREDAIGRHEAVHRGHEDQRLRGAGRGCLLHVMQGKVCS
jgi:hypothetical protein